MGLAAITDPGRLTPVTRFRRILLFLTAAAAALALVVAGPGDVATGAPQGARDANEAAARANEQVRAILDRLRKAQDPLNGRNGQPGQDGRAGDEPPSNRDGRDGDREERRPRFGDPDWYPAG